MTTTLAQKALRLIEKHGVLLAKDFMQAGVPTVILSRMVKRGDIIRVDRGMYTVPNPKNVSENHDLVQAAKRIPHGVVCLISALRFHELTTQIPHEVWIAIDGKARKPKIDYPPLSIVRFSGRALTYGVERYELEGVDVPVTSPAKTVADCFKYRNKIGVDIAIEALRDALENRAATPQDIHEAAKACRVVSVILPYLQARV